MTKDEVQLLLAQANRLTTFGMTVEKEREKLKSLAEQGFALNSLEMLSANERFNRMLAEWRQLEIAHIRLRKRLGRG